MERQAAGSASILCGNCRQVRVNERQSLSTTRRRDDNDVFWCKFRCAAQYIDLQGRLVDDRVASHGASVTSQKVWMSVAIYCSYQGKIKLAFLCTYHRIEHRQLQNRSMLDEVVGLIIGNYVGKLTLYCALNWNWIYTFSSARKAWLVRVKGWNHNSTTLLEGHRLSAGV